MTAPTKLQHIEVLRQMQQDFANAHGLTAEVVALDYAIEAMTALAPPSGEGVGKVFAWMKPDCSDVVLAKHRVDRWINVYTIPLYTAPQSAPVDGDTARKIAFDIESWADSTLPANCASSLANRVRSLTASQSPAEDGRRDTFEEWFAAIWAGSDDKPVPQWQRDGWDEYIAQRQLALGAWDAAIARITTPPPASQERGGEWKAGDRVLWQSSNGTEFPGTIVRRNLVTYDCKLDDGCDAEDFVAARFKPLAASPPSSAADGHSTSASQYDFHGDGRDNKRQPQGTTSGSSPGYSRPPHHADRFELDEGDRMTLRCALVSFSEELKRDGLGTDDHGVRMTAAYLARISRLLTRINNSAAECKTCNGIGIVGGVMGQTPESMEQVTENCPDCSDDVTAGGTSAGDDDLPGMWSPSDFTGGATGAAEQAKPETAIQKQYREGTFARYSNVPTEQAQAGEVSSQLFSADGRPCITIPEQAQVGDIGFADHVDLEAERLAEQGCPMRADIMRQAAALLRRLAGGVTVDDAMIDRAHAAIADYQQSHFHAPDFVAHRRELMRAALVAALGAK